MASLSLSRIDEMVVRSLVPRPAFVTSATTTLRSSFQRRWSTRPSTTFSAAMVSTGPVGVALARATRGAMRRKRRDEPVHAAAPVDDGLVEQALDAIAEERTQRLTLPHTVQQP